MTDVMREGVWTRGRRALTFGLVLTITLVGLEALAIATVMPDVSHDLDGLSLYGWVFSAFFLGSLLGIVEAGVQADRNGPARPFAIGLALFAIGLLAGGLAPNMLSLVLARLVQGMGAGAIPAVGYVTIGRAYPAALRPRMFAVLSTAWVLPGVIGPALSGAVADHVGWRYVFLGLLPFVAIAGAIAWPQLRSIVPVAGVTVADRRVPAVLVTLGAGLLLAGASARSLWAAVPLVVIGLVVGVPAFRGLTPPGTLRAAPGLPSAVAVRGVLTFAFFGVDAYVSLALTELHGTSITLAGVALTAATLTWTAGSWIQERRVGIVGPHVLVRAGFVAIACGIGGMLSVVAADPPIVVAIAAWATAGLGMGVAYSPLSLTVLANAPSGSEGNATAALQLSDTLGIALGTGAAGAVVSAGAALGWDDATPLIIAFGGLGAIALLGALLSGRLPTTFRLRDASTVRDVTDGNSHSFWQGIARRRSARRLKRRELLGGLDHYGAVLAMLLTLFIVLGLSEDGIWLRLLMVPALALILDFILVTSGAGMKPRRRAWILDGVVISIAVIQVVVFHQSKPYASYAAAAALTVTGFYFAFRRILEHEVISIQTLFAAASVYVLIGLSFCFIMLASAMLSGPDFLKGASPEPHDYVYASFITQTTVGYGDITPTTDWARVLCVLEALIAQLFLATVIARLVSGFGHPQRRPGEVPVDAPPPEPPS